MDKKKYIYLLILALVLLAFCIYLPLNAALNYVRQMNESHAWYTEIEFATSSYNNDKDVTLYVAIPSLIVLFTAFIHYLLIPILKPEKHHKGILPIFFFDEGLPYSGGKLLSTICVYTMPVLVPLGVYYVYSTSGYTDVLLMYLFLTLLMFGAFLFLVFYLVFFIRLIFFKHPKDEDGAWQIY